MSLPHSRGSSPHEEQPRSGLEEGALPAVEGVQVCNNVVGIPMGRDQKSYSKSYTGL